MLIKKRWYQFNEMLDKSSKRSFTKYERFRLYVDFLWNRLVRKTYLQDYIQYHFYDRNKYGRDAFIEYQRLHQLIDRCNNKEKEDIFNSKIKFNKTFNEFLGRDWIDTRESSKEEILKFISDHDKIIIKPEGGSFGIGIEIVETKGKNPEEIYQKYSGNDLFIEEVVEQNEELKKFNASTLNTFRIVTMVDNNGKSHVMDAILRIGRAGKFTDNFHNQGLGCLVDVETGVVFTKGKDKDYNEYVFHPDSGVQICGFKVPHWDKLIETSERLALVVKDVRYVGWDIGIDNKGNIVCIEGNFSADPDASQQIDQVGKYQKYFNLI